MPSGVSISQRLPYAVNRALVLFCAMTAVIVFWFFTRPPDDCVISVTFTMMSAGTLCTVSPFGARALLCLRLFLAASACIFLSAMLREHGFLLILMSGCMIPLVSAFIRHRRAAGIVMVVGQLAMASGYGFHIGVNRVIALVFSAVAALTASIFARRMAAVPPPPVRQEGFTVAETARLAVLSMTGIWIWQAFRIPEGAWIPATPAFLYMVKAPGSDLHDFCAKRLYGTIAGLYAGMLFLSVLTFFDYRMIYLIPFLACFGFFLNFLTGNYLLYSLFFMMSFCLYGDFAAGSAARFHLFQLCLSRILCTAAGILLTLIFERCFFPEKKETFPA